MASKKRNASQHSQQQQEDVHRGPRSRRARAREEQQNVIEEEQQNVVLIDNSQLEKQKTIIFKSGMYHDADILTSTAIVELLEFQKLTFVTQFHCNWYPDMVKQFYESCRLTSNAANFVVNESLGFTMLNDLVRVFKMSTKGVHEYPERGWS
ncbi:hypothetical protein LIER_39817 [Lithospermum erythrorhizon]|uniref:Uncharacterized protein n=1 Tax=Lithospermum erythrorhizon TaxID=34254 RepID=A0AAV3QR58_LITER